VAYRRNVSLTRSRLLISCRARADSSIAAVVTDVAHIVVDHRGVVNVVNVVIIAGALLLFLWRPKIRDSFV
jgi:hypothetical protein